MATMNKTVQLTEAQVRYLAALKAGLPAGVRLGRLTLEGPRGAIEALRELLTQLLAERGFVADYSTTAEGDLIEELIDALI